MDAGLIEQVLWHIHNWFVYDEIPVSECTISDGGLPASVPIPTGAWYRVQGSLFNDGLHQHPAEDLVDETFDGMVTVCAIPSALLAVIAEIEDWLALNQSASEKALASPYASESFDGYTYSIRSDLTASSGGPAGLSGWQAAFASRLNPWRKIS